jgi:hypothetical protein
MDNAPMGIRSWGAAGLFLVAAVLLAEGTAAAEGWSGAVAVGTDFPVSVSVRGEIEAPPRLRASMSLGILPAPYVSAINAFVIAIGGYEEDTGDLVEAAISNSLIWRTHLGFRPFPKLGLYGEVGYGLVALGGQATTSELVAGLTGREVPPGDESHTLSASSVLHMLDVEIGWAWLVWESWQLRAAIGGAFTVASSTTIEPDYTPRSWRATQALTDYGEAYLNDVYTAYVFAPVVSVSFGRAIR